MQAYNMRTNACAYKCATATACTQAAIYIALQQKGRHIVHLPEQRKRKSDLGRMNLFNTACHRVAKSASDSVIKNLQILRFLAASLVLFEHAQYESTTRPFIDNSHYKAIDFFFWPGGVDIFFVISGFIMYTIGSQKFGKPGASADFMLRRIIRVVPSYWIFTTLMILAAALLSGSVDKGSMSPSDIAFSYLFIPYVNAYGAYYPVLSLGWTLNYEMLFYVLFAIALCFDLRKGMVFVVACLTVLGVGGMTGLVKVPVLAFWFNSIVLEFVFGIGLAWIYQKGWRLSTPAGIGLFLAGVLAVILGKHNQLDITALDYRAAWLGLPALMMCAGLVMIERPGAGNPVIRALVFGGNISFALYLSHPFAINIVGLAFKKTGLDTPALFIATAMIAALCGAAAFYLLVEKPVTTILNGYLRKKAVPKAS
jgi:exopolysaccharide production protein ExoZ